MNLIDIRMEITRYLPIQDILYFLTIDKLGQLLNVYSYWYYILQDRKIPAYPNILLNINNIKLNIKHHEFIHQQVIYLINHIKLDKININAFIGKRWISFYYLKHQLNISNLTSLYTNYKYKFNENLTNYHLDEKHFKTLYVSRASANQVHYFALAFKVPKRYNSALTSYGWSGLTKIELYSFLFHFMYYIDVVDPLDIYHLKPLSIHYKNDE